MIPARARAVADRSPPPRRVQRQGRRPDAAIWAQSRGCPSRSQYLIPPMSVPQAVGWKPGETPTVPPGLRIQAMATGLMHPRIVYPLPNGDILVVESNSPGTKPFRPKDYIQGKVKARAGAAAKGRQPHHPAARCRRRRRSGTEDGARRPSALALRHRLGRGHALRRQHRRDHRLSHSRPGETRITAPGVKLADLPAGPINHHWTKAMVASPDGSKLYVGVGSNSNITENGMDVEEGRAAIYEVDRLTAPSASMRPARATRPTSPSSPGPGSSSPWSTSATRSGRTSFPII